MEPERNEGARPADDRAWVRALRYASHARHPASRIASLLPYLEAFPTGRHNRKAAERIEALLDDLGPDPRRQLLSTRLRSVRDAHMSPIEHDTWGLDFDEGCRRCPESCSESLRPDGELPTNGATILPFPSRGRG